MTTPPEPEINVKIASQFMPINVRTEDDGSQSWFHTFCGDWHPITADGDCTCPLKDAAMETLREGHRKLLTAFEDLEESP